VPSSSGRGLGDGEKKEKERKKERKRKEGLMGVCVKKPMVGEPWVFLDQIKLVIT